MRKNPHEMKAIENERVMFFRAANEKGRHLCEDEIKQGYSNTKIGISLFLFFILLSACQ